MLHMTKTLRKEMKTAKFSNAPVSMMIFLKHICPKGAVGYSKGMGNSPAFCFSLCLLN